MWTASARAQYRRSGDRYASDVTDAEFALIAPLLPAAKRGGRRRSTALREVLNAILYLLRTGCPWRLLPKDFPPKSTVYGDFRRFGQDGVWQRIWLVLSMAAREQAGKEAQPSAGIVDSQSVKTTEAGGPRGGACPRPAAGWTRGMPARRSTAASVIWSPTPAACPWRSPSTPPTSRIATGWPWSARA